MDTLIFFGETVKSLGDYKVGGYLVVFGDEKKTDLVGDFFTAETDFDIEDGERKSGYYNHGLDLKIKNQKIGKGSLKVDEKGVWLEGQLDARNAYADAVMELVGKGALGLSSGAVSHLVRREKVGNAQKVISWPIGEWSLTPNPCEPRTLAVSLKSYQAEVAPPAAKGLFEQELAERTLATWELWSALNRVFERIAKAASVENVSGGTVDVSALASAAVQEFSSRLLAAAVSQITEYAASGGEHDFYLKSFPALIDDARPVSGQPFDRHSELAVSAVQEFAAEASALSASVKAWVERGLDKLEFRAKSGRTISAANRDRIKACRLKVGEAVGVMQALAGDLDKLITMAEPKEAAKSADPAEVRRLHAEFLRLQAAAFAV